MTTLDANAYARAVPGHDPVHTVIAIELLQLALANYDAGFYQVPTIESDDLEELGTATAWAVARRAVADAEVLLDLEPWAPGLDEWSPADRRAGIDDHVAAVECAIDMLQRRVATRGKRRPVRPL